MPIIESRVDPHSATFRANREQMLALIGGFRALEQKVRDFSNARRDRFRARGQLLPRERVALLIDPGAPWLELSTLAGLRMHDDDGAEGIQGGGGISGIGYVSGIRCIVSANDSAIKGGTSTPMGVKKHLRIQQIALENKLPFVRLVESGGANLLYQAEMFVEGGRGFANQARMSAAGIPQVTVVHGSSTAGGAYLPGLSDYVILVRGRAKVFLAGPPLLARRDRRDRDRRRARRRGNARDGVRPRRIPRRGRCATASASRAKSWPSFRGMSSSRRASKSPSRSRAIRPRSWPASCRATTASLTTCARSSPASSTNPISSISRRSTARTRYAATPRSKAVPSASSATTGRSTPTARPRRRSSSSSAARPTCRSSTCRTRPATWSAARPSAPASSSTARR